MRSTYKHLSGKKKLIKEHVRGGKRKEIGVVVLPLLNTETQRIELTSI